MTPPGRDPRAWLSEALGREDRASAEVARVCAGGRWTMRVPVDEERDSDTVIAASLADVPRLVGALTAVLDLADEWDEQADRFLNSDLRRGAYIAAASGARAAIADPRDGSQP